MTTLTLPLPPSVNAMYRNVPRRGRVKTRAYKQWQSMADAFYLEQKRKAMPVRGPYELRIIVPRKTLGDIDNRMKAISDALVRLGLTDDDRYCVKTSIERGDVEACCQVEIIPAQ